MGKTSYQASDDSRWDLETCDSYRRWRHEKLGQAVGLVGQSSPVMIGDLACLTEDEKSTLIAGCAANNGVLYCEKTPTVSPELIARKLLKFSKTLGLEIAEKHRSAGKDGIVALQISESSRQKRYIPYSSKKMNWHTDGYYNAQDQKIRAMVLHCVRAASDGGVNQFLDPEIAYIRLRDQNPAYIKALMHPQAMTIPANEEPDGDNRPVSIGPVFAFDPKTGALEMRYTARRRSIEWRLDSMTQRAVKALSDVLGSEDPHILTVKMGPGMGILCNNSLHNRTGFDASPPDVSHPQKNTRLLMRVRFHNRVKGA